MKKSQLRNIIRESIKELMTEQVNGMHQSIQMEICDCQPSTASSCQTLVPNMNGHNAVQGHTCNGQMCQQSDIGKIFTYNGNFGSENVNFTSITFKLLAISQPAPILNTYPPFNMVNSSCPTSAGSCNPAAWSNHANWTSTFTNTVNNLNPNNPNQPCNFLNNKIAQFTANLQGTGQGGYQNMQNCKLALANQLHTQNNC